MLNHLKECHNLENNYLKPYFNDFFSINAVSRYYECQENECDRKFFSYEGREDHMLTHKNDKTKKYFCKFQLRNGIECGKSYLATSFIIFLSHENLHYGGRKQKTKYKTKLIRIKD